NLAGPIAQSGSDNGSSGTSANPALGAFHGSSNSTFAAYGVGGAVAQPINQKSGWTELAEVQFSAGNSECQYIASNDAAPNATWATAGSWVAVSLEVRDSDGGAEPPPPRQVQIGARLPFSLSLAAAARGIWTAPL